MPGAAKEIGPTLLALFASGLLGVCHAQDMAATLNPLNPAHSTAEGPRLYNVSTFVGYYDYNFPQNAAVASARPDATYGVMASAGWQRFRGRTNFSIRYSGAFSGGIRNSRLNGVSQNASVAVSRSFGTKWNVSLSMNGADSTYQHFIFVPSSLGSISQSSATTDDLAAAMSIGQFSSSANGLLLNGSPAGAMPTQAVLLGSRVLTYAASVGLTYTPSSRLSFRFGSFATAGERRTGDTIAGAQENYILPRSMGADVGVSMSYLFSPRTTFDVSVTQNYVSTIFQKAYGSSATAGLGRKMGRHWFLRGYAGGYFVEHQTNAADRPRQTIGGASIGFTTYGNTLLASYSRTGYDVTSGTVGRATYLSGAWNWRRPRNNWAVSASYSRVQNATSGVSSVYGWQATGGYIHRLGHGLLLTGTYTYLDSRGAYLSTANSVTLNGVRFTLGWAPGNRSRNHPSVIGDPDDH